jgi:glutamate/tyrosine decarboxylase-like PLP-dependent enzyme
MTERTRGELSYEDVRRVTREHGLAPGLRPGSRAVEAWFLGPKAENAELLERLVVEAVRDHVYWRRNFHPDDPDHITGAIKRSPEYVQAVDKLQQELRRLLGVLKKSVPFFSTRYQGHMLWDTTLPSVVGYFAAMLHNQNNVSFEASPATTVIELLVGEELSEMLGWPADASPTPWGHVTCDGSVANLEALWAYRNARLLPVTLRRAARQEHALGAGRAVPVRTCEGRATTLTAATLWEALNLPLDEALALPSRLIDAGVPRAALEAAVAAHSVQRRGVAAFLNDPAEPVPAPVVFAPATAHYSMRKAMAILGLGDAQLVSVPVDRDARMDAAALEVGLRRCLDDGVPVAAVVAVLGATESSAVDPLDAILALRTCLREEGLDFPVHVDAAWGGYFACIDAAEREAQDAPRAVTGLAGRSDGAPPTVSLSHHLRQQIRAVRRADSATVDPHKSGYIPYPAGALCYRNGALRKLVTFVAPYLGEGEGNDPHVGIYGVEGSKPGAAAAAVHLSHRVIGRSGYGTILGEALFSAKMLYARLLSMAGPEDGFLVQPVPRLPAEREGRPEAEVEAQRALIRERIGRRSHAGIRGEPEVAALLPELGPDQNIVLYAFNVRLPDGTPNRDLALANRLNEALYARMRVRPGDDIYGYRVMVSHTRLRPGEYGEAFLRCLTRRLGLEERGDEEVVALRSVVMDPWVTEAAGGSFLDIFEAELRAVVGDVLRELRIAE